MRAKGISVSANGKHHIVTNREPVVTEELAEKDTALCGGLCTPSYLKVEGSRLSDAYQRGELCETCLEQLKERDATIPGFIVEGELVGVSKRIEETDSKTRYAVGLEHLFWVEADDEEEAIENGMKKIAELDEDDIRDLDVGVFDKEEL